MWQYRSLAMALYSPAFTWALSIYRAANEAKGLFVTSETLYQLS